MPRLGMPARLAWEMADTIPWLFCPHMHPPSQCNATQGGGGYPFFENNGQNPSSPLAVAEAVRTQHSSQASEKACTEKYLLLAFGFLFSTVHT